MNGNARPMVSIGIPTYNRAEAFLSQALECAINQTYPNLEIVVSDNCSTDRTEALVRGYADRRIRYYKHDQNIGAINNYNSCLNQAKGQYFLLLHDDDMIDPDFIEVCVAALGDKSERGVILAGIRLIDGNGDVVSETPNQLNNGTTEQFFLGWFSSKVALYLCSTIYNTKRLKELGGFHSKTDHFVDVVATVQLAELYGRADVHDVKASFRRHDSNMGGDPATIDDWVEDSRFLLDVMIGLISTKEGKERIRKEGISFLSKKNYRLCSTIESPMKRLSAYYHVYKRFDYGYSPIRFWYNKYIIAYIKSAISKTKRLLAMEKHSSRLH